MDQMLFTVPELTCNHCEAAVKQTISAIEGVECVTVDLETKRVAVRGSDLDDGAIRSAIQEAGYRAS
jgi:copper chaperone CopZ